MDDHDADPNPTPDVVGDDVLPEIVDRYQQAHDRGDVDEALTAFAPGAVVVDDGHRAEGTDEIRAWLVDTSNAFTYERTLMGAEATGPGTWLVANHLEGDFPGGTVDLGYRFTVADGLITELLIVP